MTPFDKGAYASSTTYVSGGAVKKAAEAVREKILKVAAEMLKEDVANLHCENAKVISRKTGKEVPYTNIIQRSLYGQNQNQIEGEASHISYVSPPPFAAHISPRSKWTPRPAKFTSSITSPPWIAASPINPKLAEGQVEGAVMNGMSYALCEEMVLDERGRMLNPSFFDYKIFTTADAPPVRTILGRDVRTVRPVRRKEYRGDWDQRPTAGGSQCDLRRLRRSHEESAVYARARVKRHSCEEIAPRFEQFVVLSCPN